MARAIRLAVINCASAEPELFHHNGKDYDSGHLMEQRVDAISASLGIPLQATVHSPFNDPKDLPGEDGFDALIIPGSKLNIDPDGRYANPWMEGVLDLIRTASDLSKPVLGICFGHQALAVAFGSDLPQVPPPLKAEIGFVPISLTYDGQNDPLFKGVPQDFEGLQFHFRYVFPPPKSSRVLAFGLRNGITQAFRMKEGVWGVQFHPDYDPAQIDALLERRREQLSKLTDISKVKTSIAQRHDSLILRNFIGLLPERI